MGNNLRGLMPLIFFVFMSNPHFQTFVILRSAAKSADLSAPTKKQISRCARNDMANQRV